MNKQEVMSALDAIEKEYQADIQETQARFINVKERLYLIPNLKAKYEANSFTDEEAAIVDEYEDLIDWQFQCWARKDEKKRALKEKIENDAKELMNAFNEDYWRVKQGIATNKLSKVKGKKKNFEINGMLENRATSSQKIGQDTLTVMIEKFSDKKQLRASTHKLLTALLIEFAETGGKDTTITIPLKKYMEMRGLENEVSARREINDDLEILFCMRLSIDYGSEPQNAKARKSRRNYQDMRLVTKKGIKNGIISCTFANDFYEALKSYKVMPLHKKALALDDRYNPHAFYFLRKLSEHVNLNYGGKNQNVISVASLLASSPEMQTYEELQKSSRGHYREKIIQPFKRDMNKLVEIQAITWQYDKAATDAEADFDTFMKTNIHFELLNYPVRELPVKEKKQGRKNTTNIANN